MTEYDLHIVCDACGQSHPSGMSLWQDDPRLDKKTVAAIYAGRDLPSEVTLVKGNRFVCPGTNRFCTQIDDERCFLSLR